MYQTITAFAEKFFSKRQIFKYGFNLSPMYRLTTARITSVSEDILEVKIKIPIKWSNRNYVGSIFGGSLFSATDPIYMIQLIQILGKDYVVWDKATYIRFKRPAYKSAYATFLFSQEEIDDIKNKVKNQNELDYTKKLYIKDKDGTVLTELDKTLYVASKEYYKTKKRRK